MLRPSRPAWASRAVLTAVGVVACVAYLAGGRLDIGTAAFDRVFSPVDSEEAQARLPALDVPLDHAPTASTAAARLSIAIALGRRTALRDLAAVAGAATIVAFGAWLGAAGVPVFSIALAMMGMAASATFWWRGVSWNGDALSPALALLAAWSVWRWLSTGRPALAAIALVSGTAALIEDRSWLAVLPALAIVIGMRIPAPRPALIAIGVMAAAGAAFGAGPVLIAEPATPWAFWSVLMNEFTPLGALLASVGIGVLLSTACARVPALVCVISLVMWFAAAPRSQVESVSAPLALCGWAVIALALAWAQQTVRGRAGIALAIVAAIALIASPALARGRFSALGRDLPSSLAARAALEVRPADLPEKAALVAESRRVDAIIMWSAKRAGRDLAIVPQSPAAIDRAIGDGMTLFAFSQAREHLERFGFMFERAWLGTTGVGMVLGHAPCVALTTGEWRDVSPLVATGSFILHGGAPGTPPGGAVVRLLNPERPRVAAIEPRSVPFEMIDPNPGSVAVRVLETGRIDPVIVTLDSVPAGATATAVDASPVTLCQGMLRTPLTLGRHRMATVRMNDPAPFLSGWHPVEADPDLFRWTGAPDAVLLAGVAPAGPIRVTITATPATGPAQHPEIRLRVNECRLRSNAMAAGQGDYEWLVAESCWRAGMNQIVIGVTPLISPAASTTSHDTRLLGARIGAIRLTRVPDQNAK